MGLFPQKIDSVISAPFLRYLYFIYITIDLAFLILIG